MIKESLRQVALSVDPERRLPEWVARKLTLLRDDYQCRYCGQRGHLQVHHIIFRSRGGEHYLANLITLCWHHHEAVQNGRFTIESRQTVVARYGDVKVVEKDCHFFFTLRDGTVYILNYDADTVADEIKRQVRFGGNSL